MTAYAKRGYPNDGLRRRTVLSNRAIPWCPKPNLGPMTPLQLKLLGGFAACLASGRNVPVAGKKNQALLAYLALNPGKRLSREKLVGLLWSDRGDAQARSSLRQALVALRHDLVGIKPTPLLLEGDAVAIAPSAVSTDVADFGRLAASKSAYELRQAAALYEGDLLEGLAVRDPAFDEWLSVERGRLHETAINALGKLLCHLENAEAVAAGQQLVALDPLREASHRALMKVYASQGQSDLAIRQYQICRENLRRELQVEPSQETETLKREIGEGNHPSPPSDRSPTAAPKLTSSTANEDLPSLPDRPSIAVLPFTNLSDDPGQNYFADGITEDIITELSRFSALFVIARNSSFEYRDRSPDVRQIGRELGVEYVLEGSVRRGGQQVRITAQLVHAASGKHVWAERYDRELGGIFAVQDEVTSSIVGALAVELESELLERARHKRPDNLSAYEHWLRGKNIGYSGPKNLKAREHFERAAAADPNFSRAFSELAGTYATEAVDFPPPEVFRVAYDKSFQYAERALDLDETNEQAHVALAWIYLYRGDCGRAKKHIERAIKLNPNDADTLASAAYLLAAFGEPEKGVKFGEAALRLNPRHPDWYLSFLITALYLSRRHTDAHALRLRVPEAFIDSTFFGAATLAHMGRLEEARIWADRAMARLGATPGGALAIAQGRVVSLLLENNPFYRSEDREHFAEGMRMAGVPG